MAKKISAAQYADAARRLVEIDEKRADEVEAIAKEFGGQIADRLAPEIAALRDENREQDRLISLTGKEAVIEPAKRAPGQVV